jgi:hypothetical protein
MWILQYREGVSNKYHTLGLYSKINKSQAPQEQARIMSEGNAPLAVDPDPDITFGDLAPPLLHSHNLGIPSETLKTFVWKDICWRRHLNRREAVGLGS